jgi:hypothetical protein
VKLRAVKLFALAAVAFLAALAPGAARAGTECAGLMVCVPVAGPWVKVPAMSGSAREPTFYRQNCPTGMTVGGLDAEVTHRTLELSFLGLLGGPVSPGVTTRRGVVFRAVESGGRPLPTAFRPLLGCVPAAGGGGRARTRYVPPRSLYLAPANPTVRRVKTAGVRRGAPTRVTHACARGERLISSSFALALHTGKQAPRAKLLSEVNGDIAVEDGRILVTATAAAGVPARLRVEVQVHAVCGSGR